MHAIWKITRTLHDFGPKYNLRKSHDFYPSYNLENENCIEKHYLQSLDLCSKAKLQDQKVLDTHIAWRN